MGGDFTVAPYICRPHLFSAGPTDNTKEMHYLRVRYRHNVKCMSPDCDQLMMVEGRTSDVVFSDGMPVRLGVEERDLRGAFMMLCGGGHEIDLYAPRDLYVMQTSSAGDADCVPIVIRTYIQQ